MIDPWPHPWRLHIHDEISSTQTCAIAAARGGAAGHLAILAHTQHAGRGRSGRTWMAPPGNLNLSVMLRPTRSRAEPGSWALRAGVAVYEAVASYLPDTAGLSLKWPNDLLSQEAKLGGILIDSELDASGLPAWVVIGVGVNLQSAPLVDGRATTCLGQDAPAPERLARTIAQRLDRWHQTDFQAVREAWLARAHPVGTMLSVTHGHQAIRAAFAGLADDGGLLLQGHVHAIASGDVQRCRSGDAIPSGVRGSAPTLRR